MLSSPVLSVFLVLATVAATALAFPTTGESKLIQVISINDISKLPQGAKLIPLKTTRNSRGLIQYTLGDRVSGDALTATGSGSESWSSPQSVELTIEYPGGGGPITRVEILVNQSSNDGQAFVSSGGIGSSYITIVVQSLNTLYLEYSAEIYTL